MAKSLRIAVADDEPDVLEFYQVVLPELGHEIVCSARNGDPVKIDAKWSEAEIEGCPAVRTAICDNGPGLNAEQVEKIFEPFYTTKTRGTGLGMAVTKRIVEARGGQIEAGPGRGGGAQILITLPRSGKRDGTIPGSVKLLQS